MLDKKVPRVTMKKYAIISIHPRFDGIGFREFDHFLGAIGKNLGNMLFTNAVWNQISGEKTRINFEFDPDEVNEKYDAVILPAANWLAPQLDFSKFSHSFAGLKIPVVMIGLGAQAAQIGERVTPHDSVMIMLRAAYERSSGISVRGAYSAEVMKQLGFSNVTVTGCPSLYESAAPIETPGADSANIYQDRTILLHSTRFSASHAAYATTPSIHRAIFRLAYASNAPILFQSEQEEIGMLTGFSPAAGIDERTRGLMLRLYDAGIWPELEKYIMERGRAPLSLEAWAEDMKQHSAVVGTRLHGTIMALNAGRPALFIPHDSRTQEVAAFAAMPTMDAGPGGEALSFRMIREALDGADFKTYETRREENRKVYEGFLEVNGVGVG